MMPGWHPLGHSSGQITQVFVNDVIKKVMNIVFVYFIIRGITAENIPLFVEYAIVELESFLLRKETIGPSMNIDQQIRWPQMNCIIMGPSPNFYFVSLLSKINK